MELNLLILLLVWVLATVGFLAYIVHRSMPRPAPHSMGYPSYEEMGGDESGKKITRIMDADYKRAGRAGLDAECGGWMQRTAYDFLVHNVPTVEASIRKHQPEWCAELGIPVEPGPGPEPPTPGSNPNMLQGYLARSSRVISDASGPRILMFCHFMEAFSAWTHGREREVEAQCRIIAQHYAGIRVLDVLGYWDGAWRGKEVTPIGFINHSGGLVAATPNYWEQKRAFVAMLHSLKLRILDDRGDMNSWSQAQKLEHMRANGQFYQGLGYGPDVLAGVWSANEAWQNGAPTIELCQQLLQSFASGAGWLPALRGLSAPGGDASKTELLRCEPPMSSWEPEMPCSFVNWSAEPASVVTCHGNRGSADHIIEHYFGYGYDDTIRKIGKPVFNTEPVGPGAGVSVGRVNDPELLCGLTAAALIGGQAWTFMSGYGVFWEGPIHSMPGFAEVARLPRFLPQDIASWPTVAHSGTRFIGTRILAVVDPTRADQAISSDGRFAIVIHTQEAPGNALACERACAEFTVINMITGQTERTGPLKVGETYRHPGVARLAVGRLA